MDEFAPTEMSSGTRVAWVTQGLVLYFERNLLSVWPQVLAAWDLILRTRFATDFKFVRRWDQPAWQAWDKTLAAHLRTVLEQAGPTQPYAHVELADDTRFPALSFDFQSALPAQGQYPRASYLRVRLPPNTKAEELLDLTKQLTDLLPAQQGVAGYLCHADERDREVGMDQVWAWARRYYGLHVVATAETTWDVPFGVWGVNWLTFLGDHWLDDALREVGWNGVKRPLKTIRTKSGLILQAGDRPTIGDQNQFHDLTAYTLASQLVEPALIAEPTTLRGMFYDHDSTPLWIRRFLDPQSWRQFV